MSIELRAVIAIEKCQEYNQPNNILKIQLESDASAQELIDYLIQEKKIMIPKNNLFIRIKGHTCQLQDKLQKYSQSNKTVDIYIKHKATIIVKLEKQKPDKLIRVQVNIYQSDMSKQPFEVWYVQASPCGSVNDLIKTLYENKILKIDRDDLGISTKHIPIMDCLTFDQLDIKGAAVVNIWNFVEQMLKEKVVNFQNIPKKQRRCLQSYNLSQTDQMYEIEVVDLQNQRKLKFKMKINTSKTLQQLQPKILSHLSSENSSFWKKYGTFRLQLLNERKKIANQKLKIKNYNMNGTMSVVISQIYIAD